MNKKYIPRIYGFHHKYSQAFLDELAKIFGFKWVKCNPQLIDKDKIESDL